MPVEEVERVLKPGVYPVWKNVGKWETVTVDLREQGLDVSGQEIMTADKVTLRLNLLLNFKVVDVLAAATEIKDFKQALYREALALASRAPDACHALLGLLHRPLRRCGPIA